MTEFPIAWIRSQFPALNAGDDFIFFDNAAGAQAPQNVLDAVHEHLNSRTQLILRRTESELCQTSSDDLGHVRDARPAHAQVRVAEGLLLRVVVVQT